VNEFPKKIAIIGVGLIGGSIALGLKQHLGAKITILGSCNNIERTKKAKESGIIDEVIDLHAQPQGLRSVTLIIIATPVGETIKLLELISKIKIKNCLIVDVGSTKEFVINTANQFLGPNISFIGTHPMAGSELSGFENADPNLFRNKPWIVCSNNHPIISELIDILGAKKILMDAKKHDELTSWASHLNLVSSSILINAIGKQKNWPEVAKIASTGFRDTTRLASSNVEMKKDIIFTNKKNIIGSLIKFQKEIEVFVKLLQNNDTFKISNYLSTAKTIRDNWIENNFS